jgi:hypothetical protein
MNTKWKTVFVEYSSYKPGQHFITVIETLNHKRIIVGRIYREYDKGTGKSKYIAQDFAGNQIFADTNELSAIKKKFIEYGESLAMSVPVIPHKTKQTGIAKGKQILSRKEIINIIRERKSEKSKKREVSKTNTLAKAINDQKEKEQDLKNPEKYKDPEQTKEGVNPQDKDLETSVSNSEKPEQTVENEKSERDIELEQIRDTDNDKDQEQDIEMDI